VRNGEGDDILTASKGYTQPLPQSDYTSMPQLNANEMGMIGSGYYGQSQQYQQLLK
jgi:hypothetical protein